MRFLLDESVSRGSAVALRTHGHDAVHAIDVGLASTDDEEIIERARREDRILITRDRHFTNPVRFPPSEFPGILYIRPGNLTSQDEAALLHRVVSALSSSAVAGHLVVVSITRVTIR